MTEHGLTERGMADQSFAQTPERAQARAEIIACETCGNAERDATGRTRGECLLAELRAALDAVGAEGACPLEVSGVRCLWACGRSCAVALRAPSRVGYVIAGLDPTPQSAHALLEFAALYAGSESGAVPYKQWPLALKGHFLCRFPGPPSELRPARLGPGQSTNRDAGEQDLPPEAALP